MKAGFARLAVAVVTGLVVAIGLMLQASSSVSERRSPEQAVAFNPWNGMAREQAVSRAYNAVAQENGETADVAAPFRARALASYASEPLTPKSLTILAVSTTDPDVRQKILALATRLNRRDVGLQWTALQSHLAQMDQEAAIITLDQLLRVHPELSAQFFPPLMQAFTNPANDRTFAKMLDGSSPWHDQFAMTAVRNDAARLRLAAIRSRITITDEDFDRQLIAGLAGQGEIETAQTLYTRAAQLSGATAEKADTLSWRGDFPPFEWTFVDEKDKRAQASTDGTDLELYLRPGEGGVVAQRLILPSRVKQTVSIPVDATRPIRDGRMRAAIYCDAAKEPAIEVSLRKGANTIETEGLADGCKALRLELYARAYRGEPVFRARVARITLG